MSANNVIKFPASNVKCTGFTLSRAENQPYYTVSRTGVTGIVSPYIGFAYKNAETGQYTVTLGLERTTCHDFNAVKSYIKGKLQGDLKLAA